MSELAVATALLVSSADASGPKRIGGKGYAILDWTYVDGLRRQLAGASREADIDVRVLIRLAATLEKIARGPHSFACLACLNAGPCDCHVQMARGGLGWPEP